MSFFFDVWTLDGFILASDVRIMENGEPKLGQKIYCSPPNSKVKCAIAICGMYPDVCKNHFLQAVAAKDTLKDIAKDFAEKWTGRYAGTGDYSAVHMVGFEKINGSDESVHQLWYWRNSEDGINLLGKEQLCADLDTFTNSVPANNHIPWKIRELTGKFPGPTLEDQHLLVTSFLRLHQPLFIWNGDTSFWRSAAGSVGSALNLLWKQKHSWTMAEATQVTKLCFEFLTKVGSLLPDSTVGLSPDGKYDLLTITPDNVTWVSRTDINS
jgi:hypothetical protein